jgi:HSP20 family protein
VLKRTGRVAGRLREAAGLSTDLLESESEYLLVVDAPGATTSDVSVAYRDGAVEVRVDRFRRRREGFEMRFPGRALSMDARVELPDDAAVDAERARAELEDNGTLYVYLPKTAPADADRRAGADVDDADDRSSGERDDE